eukprot:TRINITY_DN2746_c0_g1_i4.p1 TRINITY_DN2746_c0_g1~~TRINITY_DN2746_c0_g1_i4.p1  ORF type:complete len:143 (+),score=45.37 TRINITY_DN2746_c0_g1_i4:442-870(+)
MPGTFNSSIPGETSFASGYYLAMANQAVGDEATPINFHYYPTLGFTISFTRIDSTLNVVHTVKTPITVFLSSLAGAITSILGALAGAMQLIETLTSEPPEEAKEKEKNLRSSSSNAVAPSSTANTSNNPRPGGPLKGNFTST